ncbi:hypothetical protein SAY86_008068 [Trapa natans]|uniref:Uncharacterized protein n=1 Tax=Trapa natans TaxID=22666 RepID=A0AAN7QXQ2_TRANT|nr:hypothetical protein SAY86_008068 [Trapa natans]
MPPERYTSLSKKNIFSLLSRHIGFDNGSKVIWWFKVDGTIKFPLPAGIYTVTFRLHLGKFSKRMGWRVCGFEHTHGWDIKPVHFELFTTDGQEASFECCLDEMGQNEINGNHKRRCWIDYRVGFCSAMPWIVDDSTKDENLFLQRLWSLRLVGPNLVFHTRETFTAEPDAIA